MRIRPATVDDVDAIATVHVRSWQSGYRDQLPDDVLDALDPAERIPRWTAVVDATSWPERGTLVADEGSAGIVGFANLSPTRDTDHDPDVVGEITSFYVAPEIWARGVGRRLMAASIATLALRYRQGALWVLGTNARAIRFYEATGWRADGAVKNDAVAGTPVRHLRYRHDLLDAARRMPRDPLP